MSARRISKNYRNVTGIAAHSKSKGVAAFELTLERDFLSLVQFSPDVVSFEIQPVTIKWDDHQGNKRRYTPDVLVHFTDDSDQASTLFEVKYRDDLAKNWKDLKPKFKQAISFSKGQGWRFKIVSEVEIRTSLLKTVRFLLPYTRQGSGPQTYTELLETKLKELGETTPRELLQAVFEDELSQAKLAPTLWYLVGTFKIGCDLTESLTMKSKIWCLP